MTFNAGLLVRLHLTVAPLSVARSGRPDEAAGRVMTALLGRATAYLGAGRKDPERLGSAIAEHAHCAQGALIRRVTGLHNGEHGTSVPTR